jgi:hypothetical protein
MSLRVPSAFTIAALLVLAGATVAPPVSGQGSDPSTGQWHGQDNEFGKIRMPYQAQIAGEAIPIEARIVLNTLYTDKDGTYFLFAFDAKNTPLHISYDGLYGPGGESIPVYRTDNADGQEKWFIDVKSLPAAGSELVLKGTLGATSRGKTQVGAIVVPFTYRWEEVRMDNGIPASLYAYTQVDVQKETRSVGWSLPIGKVPAPGGLATLAAIAAVATALAAIGGRRGSR